MKLLAFAASSSSQSINKQLVTYAAGLMEDAQVEILDLNSYELPLFSEDKEKELGQPQLAKDFLDKIKTSDAVVISFAEHNGSYSTAYKNLFDWCSRINPKVYEDKPLVLLSTSPGARGGATVMEMVKNSMPRFGGQIKASMSVPSFYDNFDSTSKKLNNKELEQQLIAAMHSLVE